MARLAKALRPILGLTALLLLPGALALAPPAAAEVRTSSGLLTAAVYSKRSLRLTWWPAWSNRDEILYTVSVDGKPVAETRRRAYRFDDLQAGTTYDMRVTARNTVKKKRWTIGEVEVTTLGGAANPFEPDAPDPIVTAGNDNPPPPQPSAPTVPEGGPAEDLPTHSPDGIPYCD